MKGRIVAGLALLASANAFAQQQPWEANLFGTFWQADHRSLGFDTGLGVTLNYYLSTPSMQGVQPFVGLLGVWGEGDSDSKDQTFGGHIGARFWLNQMNRGVPLYVKAAIGVYSVRLSNIFAPDGPTTDESTGAGGFVGLGYETIGSTDGYPVSLELGYFIMPTVSSIDNNGWYAGFGFRF